MNPAQALMYARYNQWMNDKIYQTSAQLSEEELKRDHGAFFKSVHGTLNHIMLGDKVWFGRFVGEPFKPKGFDQILHEDFAELRSAREVLDRRFIEWAGNLTAAKLDSTFTYSSILGPEPRSCPLWAAVAHFFNHQTHHRGQITTLLTQCKLDVGVTDMIAMPGVVTVGVV